MPTFNDSMTEYKKQMQLGVINQAYQGLMDYLLGLRNTLTTKHPEYAGSGSFYFGYMDMTYFPLLPPVLKQRNLKIAIVFLHQEFRFELWLAGTNKAVQKQTWQALRAAGWEKYPLVESLAGRDAVIEHILVDAPDFSDSDALTQRIEAETLQFIHEIEDFLIHHS